MTTFVLSRLARRPRWLDALLASLAAFAAGVREGRAIEQRYAEIARLPDAELARQGFASREQARRAAVTGRRPRS